MKEGLHTNFFTRKISLHIHFDKPESLDVLTQDAGVGELITHEGATYQILSRKDNANHKKEDGKKSVLSITFRVLPVRKRSLGSAG